MARRVCKNLNFCWTASDVHEAWSRSDSVGKCCGRLSWKPGVSRQVDEQGCLVDRVSLVSWRCADSDRGGIHNLDHDRKRDR